jgi:threonine/homoserine/homoserine lactone efflux protein
LAAARKCRSVAFGEPTRERIVMPIDPQLFQLYLVAAVVLILAPGPDSLLVVSRGMFGGRRAGWVTAAGTTTGNVTHAALAAAGVSAVVAASPALFDALRLAGAGYLAWLGAKALRDAARAWRSAAGSFLPAVPLATGRRAFAHAFLTNLLNPREP